MYLSALLVFPLAIPIICKYFFRHQFTVKEFAAHIFLILSVGSIAYGCTLSNLTADVQVLNGSVVNKHSERVSCSHSYRCHCHEVCSGSGKDRSCHESCQTCYDHSYDVDWVVDTTVGRLEIGRIDRQGIKEPPRFSLVKQGEPAAKEVAYVNYVKAVPDSIFHDQVLDRTMEVPAYPSVYDYYRYKRVVNLGGAVSAKFADELNDRLNVTLRTMGAAKEVNLIVVMSSRASPAFVAALRQSWINGKKNDVVVVMQINNDRISFVDAFGWSKASMVFVALRDDLLALPLVTAQNVHDVIVRDINSHFLRMSMSEFKYLADDIHPSTQAMAVILLLELFLSIGLQVFFVKQDPFN